MNILGKWIRRLIAPAGLFCWFAAAAHADLVTFEFTGVVTQVGIDDLYGDISFNDAITGSYSFNSLAADGIPSASAGSYTSLGIPYVFNASFAGHVFSVQDYINIGVVNSVVDQYTVFALNPTLTLEIFLEDNSGAVFGNDLLPLSPPPIGSFALRDFHFQEVLDGGETQVDGRIDSLTCSSGCTETVVPEPSALIPICAILAGLGVVMRKRRAAGRVFFQFE